MKDNRYQILLTNDDGIQSPGLWAAAEALAAVGYVTIAAPRDQASSTGRSQPITSDGQIIPSSVHIGDEVWTVYAIGGSPAQTVLHGVLDIMPVKPDLVVSGINYGENIGSGVTVSGTVGAAIEAAAMGIPSIAASLELVDVDFLSYSPLVDFSSAAFFTAYFAKMILEHGLPEDVDVLKVDVPANATPETPWHITHLARHRYYFPFLERKATETEPSKIRFEISIDGDHVVPGTDVHTLLLEHEVSVTPLSLDMTSRVDLKELENSFKTMMNG
ncbi:MAG: 5'/3'-nucleotidase SurE [Anaerolineaceae bacterium]